MYKPSQHTAHRYNYICPHCGSCLDPGEHCDCEQRAAKQKDLYERTDSDGSNKTRIYQQIRHPYSR